METIGRNLYRGAVSAENAQSLKDGAAADVPGIKKLVDEGKLMGLSLYVWKQHVFLYYETIDCAPGPDALLPHAGKALQDWPGGEAARKWVPLVDIFHFNAPAGLEHWRRKSPVGAHLGKIGVLKPDRIQNYIFYHYALQEERAFGGDKYQIIGLGENILFAYMEAPAVQEAPVTEPKLKTSVVPKNWADAGISPSFIPWQDRIGTPEERLRNMEEAVSVWRA